MNINKEISSIIKRNPFFGELLIMLDIIESTDVPTLGIGLSNHGINLYINKTYWKTLSQDERIACLEHELLHIVNNHIERGKEFDMFVYNLAADFAINQQIRNLPKGTLDVEKYKFPKDLTTEAYYELINKNTKTVNISIDFNNSGSHKMWNSNSLSSSIGNSIIKNIVKEALKKSGNINKDGDVLKSDLPDNIKRSVEELFRTSVSWKNILNNVVATNTNTGYLSTIKKHNRRFSLMRGFRKEEKLKILVGIDTSGSIDDEALGLFKKEIYNLNMFDNIIDVVECDAEIHNVYRLKKRQKISNPVGGGGTDFRPVFEKAKTLKPDVIIYFTDGFGDFPEGSKIKTLWALTNNYDVPFGRKILLNDAIKMGES